MTQPWLSILIPTYNGAAYLSSALDSIVIQGDNQIECIVIDDGSTDATVSIIESYSNKLPIKLVQRQKGNWVANTNYALSLASGDYVCFLHQDDLWLEGRLPKMKSIIKEYPDVNLLLHPSLFIDSSGNSLGSWQYPFPQYPQVVDSSLAIERLLIQNFIAIPAPIFKREAALSVGGLEEELWYTADWDFWLKLAALGKAVYYPEPLAAFRVHAGSQTVMRSNDREKFQEQMRSVMEKHLHNWQAQQSKKDKTSQVALFSTEVNTTLAAMIHQEKVDLVKLLASFISLGFGGCHCYLRDSRIWERVSARLKARLQAKSA
jgi:glycosyltransferase involved in cell wall biosynthesis